MIAWPSLLIVGGHYGSGKTEIAINLALAACAEGRPNVVLADIDIVNPYFRSYEQRARLEHAGATVITGSLGGTADMPALPPALGDLLSHHDGKTAIIDLGGDPVGAGVLARYHDRLDGQTFAFYIVLNARRPETATCETSVAMIEMIEAMARQRVTGVINNTHLLHESTFDDVSLGDRLAREVSEALAIPYVFAAVPKALAAHARTQLSVPVVPLTRYMVKPWETTTNEGEYEWLHE